MNTFSTTPLKTILLIVFILIYIPTNAQIWEWIQTAGGPKADRSNALKVDKWGNIYIAGYYNWQAYFGSNTTNGYNIGDKNLFVAKYDSLGNCLWVKQPTIISGNPGLSPGYLDDRVIGMDVDDNGNIYITGVFWINTGIVLGNYYLQDSWFSCCDNVFIAKLDSAGNFLWARWAGSFGDDQGQDIVVDKQGNSYVTGYYSACGYSGIQPSPMFFENSDYTTMLPPQSNPKDTFLYLAKYNTNGDVVWSRYFGRAYSNGRKNALALEKDSFIYVGGGFRKIFPVDNTTLTVTGDTNDIDIFVAKFDVNGNFIWAKKAGSIDDERVNAISADQQGNVYVTGEFGKKLYFDTAISINNYKKRDVFVAKIDKNGNWQWARSAGSYDGNERGTGIIAVNDRVYVCGQVGINAQFGNISLNNPKDSLNAFVARISTNGQWLWAIGGGGKTTQDRAIGIDYLGNNILYVSGYIKDTSYFDTQTILTYQNTKDIFLARIRDDYVANAPSYLSSSIQSVLYPNPTERFVFIHLPLQYKGTFSVKITDMTGKEMVSAKYQAERPVRLDLDAFHLKDGIYLMQLYDEHNHFISNHKLVKINK